MDGPLLRVYVGTFGLTHITVCYLADELGVVAALERLRPSRACDVFTQLRFTVCEQCRDTRRTAWKAFRGIMSPQPKATSKRYDLVLYGFSSFG